MLNRSGCVSVYLLSIYFILVRKRLQRWCNIDEHTILVVAGVPLRWPIQCATAVANTVCHYGVSKGRYVSVTNLTHNEELCYYCDVLSNKL